MDVVFPSTGTIAREAVPSLFLGVASAGIPIVIVIATDRVTDLLYTWIPDLVGFDGFARWWIFAVLTGIGVLVGLLVWMLPGHGGPDPATAGLVGPPIPMKSLPSLALVVILALGAGVSLGPENPLIAINVAVAAWVLARLWPSVPTKRVVWLTTSATIGVLFGTPLAGPLAFVELAGRRPKGELWENMFAPLVAAGAGTVTMFLLDRPMLILDVPDYRWPTIGDVLIGSLVAVGTAALFLLGVPAFHRMHALFHALPNPVLGVGLGGAVLGVLGAVGGPATLFKDADNMARVTADAANQSAGRLALWALINLAALLVASSCGFRGGRTFASVFVGLDVGLFVHAVFDSVPPALSISCAVLGALVVAVRSCWLGLFIGATMVASFGVIPVLCVAVFPVWLLAVHRGQLVVGPNTVPLEKHVS
ncbi:ion channel protein [Prescottella agglutinans]|uniref:Ion channel protein n=1 Tax=Prescottella agglutinans TaxID=1644129 RepID=A0A3S3AG22_9NOCA|nr:ion channel protein [Prescottella agglutinans]